MKNPKRRSAPASRERILQEAEHLIHMRGYHCTSLDDIAKRCRMTKANLLHHFRSKEDLGLAVLDYKIEAYRRCCIEPLFSNGTDPMESVRELFAAASRFYRGNGCRAGCFVGNMALEMSDLSERFREKAGAFFDEWAARIAGELRRHQDLGRFSPKMDAESTAEAVLALYEGAIMLARTHRDHRIFEGTGGAAIELLGAFTLPGYQFAYQSRNAREVNTHGTQTKVALRLLNQLQTGGSHPSGGSLFHFS